jgi:uncharacterized protein YdhG (YjbR/CyaY superfamily)
MKDPMEKVSFTTHEEYIAAYPEHIASLLQQLKRVIKEEAPQAVEVISYNMPAFKFKGMLVYYAAHKEHIGLYPMASPIKVFEIELKEFKTSKGAIQFPFETGIPEALVRKIIRFRVMENIDKELSKKK